MAEVQLYSTHGVYNKISFNTPSAYGIKTGNTESHSYTEGGQLMF